MTPEQKQSTPRVQDGASPQAQEAQGERPQTQAHGPQPNGRQEQPAGAAQPLHESLQQQIAQAIRPVLAQMQQQIAQEVRQKREQDLHLQTQHPQAQAQSQTQRPGKAEQWQDTEREQRGPGKPRTPVRAARRHREVGAMYDPKLAARVGFLRMARHWADTGSVHQALYVYREILVNYPGTSVASAATEDLVTLAESLEAQGQYYAALDIFRMLEELL